MMWCAIALVGAAAFGAGWFVGRPRRDVRDVVAERTSRGNWRWALKVRGKIAAVQTGAPFSSPAAAVSAGRRALAGRPARVRGKR